MKFFYPPLCVVLFHAGDEVAHFNVYNIPKAKGGECGNLLTIWLWVWVGTLLRTTWTTLAKAILFTRVVLVHFCNILNVVSKVMFGYGDALWNHLRKKLFIFVKWNVWSNGGLDPFFKFSTTQGKVWIWGALDQFKGNINNKNKGDYLVKGVSLSHLKSCN